MTQGNVQIKINGVDTAIAHSSYSRFTEVIELIKSVIDPDHIITDIKIDGADPSELQWQGVVSQLGTSILEIETGEVSNYIAQKMAVTSTIIDEIYLLFRQARKSYHTGNSFEGNKALAQAVKAAKAFFEWYYAMLNLVPTSQKSFYNIEDQVRDIAETCQRICTQQLYQNWKGIADTIENELEPKLDKLESFSRRFEDAAKAA